MGHDVKVLLIKTSSMGDMIHTLPALTDAHRAVADVTFDWVAEDVFAEIPSWHPQVKCTIPVALRRWRKGFLARSTRAELQQLRMQLRNSRYDLILDAQGLAKSAFLTFFAKGLRVGLDWQSAREPIASLAYQRKLKVNFYQHAISRMRLLFAHALGYEMPNTLPDYSVSKSLFINHEKGNYVVFLHGTTWKSKQWPEAYWIRLAEVLTLNGYRIKISGGSDEEISRAKRIAKQISGVDLLPRLSIHQMAALLSNAKAAVSVDTGFGHLAAALDVPVVSLYSSTNPIYTGIVSRSSIQLAAEFACAPCLNRVCNYKKNADVNPACFGTVTPSKVWQALQSVLC